MARSVLVAALVACGVSAHADPKPMRLLTYNLNWANSDRITTMRAIADADADVVLLQEVDANWKRALEDTLSKRYPHHAFRPAERYAGGIAVLSKLPIKSEDVYASPLASWFPAQRIVLEAPFGALQILNVHLRPAYDGSWIRGFMTTPPLRRKEIESYWPHLKSDLPTIVAGDFNEDPDGTAVAFLANHGLSRVPVKGPRTWHYELLEMNIDHVLIDDTLAAHDGEVLDAGTSDHRPVVVTIDRR